MKNDELDEFLKKLRKRSWQRKFLEWYGTLGLLGLVVAAILFSLLGFLFNEWCNFQLWKSMGWVK